MELVLKGWPGRISAAAVAVAATAALSLTLWKHLEATWLAQEGSLASLERAQQLEPRNAELYWRAGLLELYSESSSPSDAATAFDQATKLDPRAGIYWADLALARENAGDMEGAGRDLARARAAEPRTPVILWRSMNFALRNNQQQQDGIHNAHAEAQPEQILG
jgi:tetratricopeptide (TPR) repeat protein